jgi:hypothetical protein
VCVCVVLAGVRISSVAGSKVEEYLNIRPKVDEYRKVKKVDEYLEYPLSQSQKSQRSKVDACVGSHTYIRGRKWGRGEGAGVERG